MKKQQFRTGKLEKVILKIDSIINDYNIDCERNKYADCETPAVRAIKRIFRVSNNAVKKIVKK